MGVRILEFLELNSKNLKVLKKSKKSKNQRSWLAPPGLGPSRILKILLTKTWSSKGEWPVHIIHKVPSYRDPPPENPGCLNHMSASIFVGEGFPVTATSQKDNVPIL